MTKKINKVLIVCVAVMSASLFSLLFTARNSVAAQDAGKQAMEEPMGMLKAEALSYFQPVSGKIVSVEGNEVRTDIGLQKSAKAGMRLEAFKEGVGFIHPITKETLGKIELPVGIVEITKADETGSTAVIISGKQQDFAGANVKIAGTKVRVLFYQGTEDWQLGDNYYQLLKESGRFELIDTGLDTADDTKIIAEAKAKKAEIALVLRSSESPGHTELLQRLFWAGDSRQFSAKTVSISSAYAKELKFKAGQWGPKEGEVLLSFRLPLGVSRLAVGDLDGDGEPEIAIAKGDVISIYKPGASLILQHEFTVPSTSEVLWMDRADTNKNGKDEIFITAKSGDEINSFCYELGEKGFQQLWKVKGLFVRRFGDRMIGQNYSRNDGYDGPVYDLKFEGGKVLAGSTIKLPPGVNIYDFQDVSSPDGKQATLAWGEDDFLYLYNDKGLKTWVSREDFGGFSTNFKREAPTVMVDRGSWSVKDRLVIKDAEVLVIKRKPLLGMARGLGYKASEIVAVWWNGLGVEQRVFIEEVGGNILDYAIVGDRIIVLAKPLFGMKAGNILKGENPWGAMLYVFSLKGR